MPDMRHAGMHWPTGGENPSREAIYSLPGVRQGGTIMLADSARFWYEEARSKSPLVIWRGLPRQDKLPALLGYDPSKVAEECLNLWDDQPHYGVEYFTPLNEVQFPWESGESPFRGFAFWTSFLTKLRMELRKRLPEGTKLVWPAWCPDQPYMDAPFDNAVVWVDEAKRWDVISAHVYSHDLDAHGQDHYGAWNVERTHSWYRGTFPHHPIIYTEWNGNNPGPGRDSESLVVDMLATMAEICRDDPLCLGFLYYIWQTQKPNESHLNVWGNSRREAVFRNPPTTEPEASMYALPSRIPSTKEIFDVASILADLREIDLETAIALLIAESGPNFDKLERWNQWTFEATTAIKDRNWPALESVVNRIKSLGSDDISFGPAHQAWRWSPQYAELGQHPAFRYDVGKIMEFRKEYIERPDIALDVAFRQLKQKLDTWGDPLEALCRYNSPNTAAVNNPNRANYRNALVLAPAKIAELQVQPEDPDMPEYKLGFKDLADRLGREVVGDPLTDETYFTPDVSMQFTENGMMVYTKDGNKAYFFEMAR